MPRKIPSRSERMTGAPRTMKPEVTSDQNAGADHDIFAERDLLARHVQPLAQQGRLRDQGRGIAFPPVRTISEKLADLGLGIAGNDVSVALLDELHAALHGLARGGTAKRHEGESEGADAADKD